MGGSAKRGGGTFVDRTPPNDQRTSPRNLELDAGGDLDVPRIAHRPVPLPEVGAGQVGVESGEPVVLVPLGLEDVPVPEVEGLDAQLQVDATAELRVLDERQVMVLVAEAADVGQA